MNVLSLKSYCTFLGEIKLLLDVNIYVLKINITKSNYLNKRVNFNLMIKN